MKIVLEHAALQLHPSEQARNKNIMNGPLRFEWGQGGSLCFLGWHRQRGSHRAELTLKSFAQAVLFAVDPPSPLVEKTLGEILESKRSPSAPFKLTLAPLDNPVHWPVINLTPAGVKSAEEFVRRKAAFYSRLALMP